MRDGQERRQQLIRILENSTEPVSGGSLAKMLHVSRQIIAQDIALLRAVNEEIFATPRGYVLDRRMHKRYRRSYAVNHTREQIVDELYTIIDNGGKVLNVIVAHDVYGQIQADLILETREDVDAFNVRIRESKAGPLLAMSDGNHIHTVEASSEKILDNIEEDLKAKGYLIS